jgi:hypothetical protein
MWLVDVAHVWDGMPLDGMRGTELALRLLNRTQELLGDGQYWKSEALALTYSGGPCDPLSNRAHFFSLGGAAARARWEMRGELADAEISPEHMKQVMNALFSVAREYRKERGGWTFACALLDGMQAALEQYHYTQQSDERSITTDESGDPGSPILPGTFSC